MRGQSCPQRTVFPRSARSSRMPSLPQSQLQGPDSACSQVGHCPHQRHLCTISFTNPSGASRVSWRPEICPHWLLASVPGSCLAPRVLPCPALFTTAAISSCRGVVHGLHGMGITLGGMTKRLAHY